MGKMCVFVIAHKPYDIKLPDGYEMLQVGNGPDFAKLRDNTGDNIAFLNGTYCEQTGLYWAWKNQSNYDYLGLVHYRRYFMGNSVFSKNVEDDILKQKDIERILGKKGYDVIIRSPAYKAELSSMLYRTDTPESRDPVMAILEEVISDTCPDYLQAFEDVAYGYQLTYGNMFIAKKHVFDSYCEWLFNLYKNLENYFEKHGYKIKAREMGYIGEFLISIYMHAKVPKARTYYCESLLLPASSTYMRHRRLKNFFKTYFKKTYLRLKNDKDKKAFIAMRYRTNRDVEQDIIDGKVFNIWK